MHSSFTHFVSQSEEDVDDEVCCSSSCLRHADPVRQLAGGLSLGVVHCYVTAASARTLHVYILCPRSHFYNELNKSLLIINSHRHKSLNKLFGQRAETFVFNSDESLMKRFQQHDEQHLFLKSMS